MQSMRNPYSSTNAKNCNTKRGEIKTSVCGKRCFVEEGIESNRSKGRFEGEEETRAATRPKYNACVLFLYCVFDSRSVIEQRERRKRADDKA